MICIRLIIFFFQAEDGIRDRNVTGVQTCALPIARLRATGAGFCYNIGRVFAASGPFVIGLVTAAAGGSSGALMRVMCWLALVPLGAALLARFVLLETRGRTLPV